MNNNLKFNIKHNNCNSKYWFKTPNTMLWVKLNSFSESNYKLNQITNWIYIGINGRETQVIWNPYIHAHPWHASHPKSASENNNLFLQLHVHAYHMKIALFTWVQFPVSLTQLNYYLVLKNIKCSEWLKLYTGMCTYFHQHMTYYIYLHSCNS